MRLFLFVFIYLIFTINNSEAKKNYKEIKESTELYTIEIKYPVEVFDKKNEIEKFIFSEIKKRKKQLEKNGELYDLIKTNPNKPKYLFDIDFKKFSSKKYSSVSYLLNILEYAGGANPYLWVKTFTFNKNGLINIENILNFNDYNDIKLTKLLANKAIKINKDVFDSEMLYNGLGLSYLKEDGITLDRSKCKCDGYFFGSNFQNFVLKNNEISFFFNKYQISAGFAGTPEINLSFNEIKQFLL